MDWHQQNVANYNADKAKEPAIIEDKAKAREKLNADIEAFLASGGKIDRSEPGDTALTISTHISKSFPKSL